MKKFVLTKEKSRVWVIEASGFNNKKPYWMPLDFGEQNIPFAYTNWHQAHRAMKKHLVYLQTYGNPKWSKKDLRISEYWHVVVQK